MALYIKKSRYVFSLLTLVLSDINLFQLNHKPFGIFKEILHSNAIHFIVANKKIQWVVVSYD